MALKTDREGLNSKLVDAFGKLVGYPTHGELDNILEKAKKDTLQKKYSGEVKYGTDVGFEIEDGSLYLLIMWVAKSNSTGVMYLCYKDSSSQARTSKIGTGLNSPTVTVPSARVISMSAVENYDAEFIAYKLV